MTLDRTISAGGHALFQEKWNIRTLEQRQRHKVLQGVAKCTKQRSRKRPVGVYECSFAMRVLQGGFAHAGFEADEEWNVGASRLLVPVNFPNASVWHLHPADVTLDAEQQPFSGPSLA